MRLPKDWSNRWRFSFTWTQIDNYKECAIQKTSVTSMLQASSWRTKTLGYGATMCNPATLRDSMQTSSMLCASKCIQMHQITHTQKIRVLKLNKAHSWRWTWSAWCPLFLIVTQHQVMCFRNLMPSLFVDTVHLVSSTLRSWDSHENKKQHTVQVQYKFKNNERIQLLLALLSARFYWWKTADDQRQGHGMQKNVVL